MGIFLLWLCCIYHLIRESVGICGHRLVGIWMAFHELWLGSCNEETSFPRRRFLIPVCSVYFAQPVIQPTWYCDLNCNLAPERPSIPTTTTNQRATNQLTPEPPKPPTQIPFRYQESNFAESDRPPITTTALLLDRAGRLCSSASSRPSRPRRWTWLLAPHHRNSRPH
jgi:hypothetical protein